MQTRDTAAPHEEKEQQNRPLEVVKLKTEPPNVVLREARVSAMDTPVEKPLRLSDMPLANFAQVLPGLYRSGYPEAPNYAFMQTLGLKTIVTLVNKEFPDGFQQFINANRITHWVFDLASTKEMIPIDTMQSILSIVNDQKNYPLLVHCKGGKHRTGCVMGIIRKINEWDTPSIIQEYSKFAQPKAREVDVEYLTSFKLSDLPDLVPRSRQVPYVLRTIYCMAMLVSFTLYIWLFSSFRLLLLKTT
ncbi:hypothetical protein GGR52DRAFT_566949 [Hypoxylon sp. FL1284]|nr:hypothetical protein GGR52DRAFT_566949 [Hypoxylon sp. FL1284]